MHPGISLALPCEPKNSLRAIVKVRLNLQVTSIISQSQMRFFMLRHGSADERSVLSARQVYTIKNVDGVRVRIERGRLSDTRPQCGKPSNQRLSAHAMIVGNFR